jgi:hypothetical protein
VPTLKCKSAPLLILVGLLAACQLDPSAHKLEVRKATPTADKTIPSVSPATSVTGVVPQSALRGLVLGVDGQPAAGVKIRSYLISDKGGEVIGNNGAGVIGNNGAGIIGNNSGGLVGTHGSKWQVLAASGGTALETTSDAHGRFEVVPANGQFLNLEATQTPKLKAVALDVGQTSDIVTLKLAPTGTISGKVTAPKAPQVTNFEGVDVYIPGLPYQVKADAAGNFTLENVPRGQFPLVATKVGLGRASNPAVDVKSEQTNQVELQLDAQAPVLTSLSPPYGVAGQVVTIMGTGFGTSRGAPLQISFGGSIAEKVERVGDTTLKVTVPPGAASGGINITVDQIAGNTLDFKVPQKLLVRAAKFDRTYFSNLEPGGAIVLSADTPLQVQATVFDTAGQVIPYVMMTWQATGTTVSVNDQGLVTPLVPNDSDFSTVVTVTGAGLTAIGKAGVIPTFHFILPSFPPTPGLPSKAPTSPVSALPSP